MSLLLGLLVAVLWVGISKTVPYSSADLSKIARFRNHTSNCTITEVQERHLFHLSTDEGLASHFYQLEKLWMIVKSVPIDRTIVEPVFHSVHYQHNLVSMCDIFVLPPEIKCSCGSVQHIGHLEAYCPIVPPLEGKREFHAEEFGLNSSTSAVTTDIDLKNVSCIAGSMYGMVQTQYAYVININPRKLSMPVVLQPEYVRVADAIRRHLQMQRGVYTAAHWRRGDQLTTRCAEQHSRQHDGSINCDSVQQFIATVQERKERRKKHVTRKFRVYVATNEQNPHVLHALHSAGFLTAANITTALRPYLQLTELELFVVELLILCEAEKFWYWGLSGVHDLVLRCRERGVAHKKEKI
jgi:hypothetical protein